MPKSDLLQLEGQIVKVCSNVKIKGTFYAKV